MKGLSIIIPTVLLRNTLLYELVVEIFSFSSFSLELIIVFDGDTTDDFFFHKVKEHRIFEIKNSVRLGSAESRNLGLKHVNHPYILFLDDDVQLPEGFFDKLLAIIESEQFDCFGGMYYPWYPQGKPVWLPADFGKKIPLLAQAGPIDVHEHGFLSAGIMCVKREAIEAVGGFRADLGMTNSIGYGEEDDLQIRLQAAGYRLGFVPDWWLYHAVLDHKHKVSWHLRSAYAHARDAQRIHQQHQMGASILGMIKTIAGAVLKRLPIGLRKYISEKDYYWQNLVLDVLRPVYVHVGRLVGLMRSG